MLAAHLHDPRGVVGQLKSRVPTLAHCAWAEVLPVIPEVQRFANSRMAMASLACDLRRGAVEQSARRLRSSKLASPPLRLPAVPPAVPMADLAHALLGPQLLSVHRA